MKKLAEKSSHALTPIKRTKMQSPSHQRIDNLMKLVKEFSAREMLVDEICRFLKFSGSGARKYVCDLREAGVIELARYINGTATYLGQPVYQLTPNKQHVDGFLAAIALSKTTVAAPKKERPSRQQQRLMKLGNDRHFHILGDDKHFPIRAGREVVHRDPLVAALFGSAPAQQACG
jgi:hypothetical protein